MQTTYEPQTNVSLNGYQLIQYHPLPGTNYPTGMQCQTRINVPR